MPIYLVIVIGIKNKEHSEAMDLKEFIVGAISDISSAVAEADEKIKGSGGLVNPGTHKSVADAVLKTKEAFVAPRTKLEFDIAVSATSEQSGDAGAKAKIWVVEASLGGKAGSKNESVSRLTFSLDVVLPHDKDQSNRVGFVKNP